MKRLAETSKPLTTLNYAPFLMFDRALNMSKFEIEEESYFRFYRGCPPQILLGLFLNTWSHMETTSERSLIFNHLFLTKAKICLGKPLV